MCLADKQLSALFSLVKNVHSEAVAKRLTIDRSFDCFKQILLRHSVQRCAYLEALRSAHTLLCTSSTVLRRPPYSLGIFTLVQGQAITQWLLRTYYMHYKLYQYAFTNRCPLPFIVDHISPIDICPAASRDLKCYTAGYLAKCLQLILGM